MKKVYSEIAKLLAAMNNCKESGNIEWEEKHREKIKEIVKQYFPSGSGFDAGTLFVWDESNPNYLVFRTSFHHMNDDGYYDGWTDHRVTVTPDLAWGFELKITGEDRNDIKNYILECFDEALSSELPVPVKVEV